LCGAAILAPRRLTDGVGSNGGIDPWHPAIPAEVRPECPASSAWRDCGRKRRTWMRYSCWSSGHECLIGW